MKKVAMQKYLQITDLVVKYGETVAVDGVNLSIGKGETLCLLGPSGCGKTTILRSIAGLLRPDSGAILVEGDDLIPVPIHRRDIGLVFQTWALFPHMSVRENVSYGLRMRRTTKHDRDTRVNDALDMVRLQHLADRKPSELSGGQQQRVALARSIVTRPRLLLLDEPLSSLDLRIRLELRSELRRIQQELGLTSVYVTHDHSEALALGDTVAVMGVGRVIEAGAPREIFNAPRTEYVTNFIGFDNILPAVEERVFDESVRMRVAHTPIEARRPRSRGSDAHYTAVAVSPWAVNLSQGEIGDCSGRVLSLEQQSGRVLVTVKSNPFGLLRAFADMSSIPQIGDQVALSINWGESRALESQGEARM